MREQWKKDLRDKLCDYEAPMMPEGLWDDIEKEMSARKTMPFFPHWRKVCAAVVLVLVSLTSVWFYLYDNSQTSVLTEIKKPKKDKTIAPFENNTAGNIINKVDKPVTSIPVITLSPNDLQEINTTTQAILDSVPNTIEQSDVSIETVADNTEVPTKKEVQHSVSQQDRAEEYFVADVHEVRKERNTDGISLALNASGVAASGGNLSFTGNVDYDYIPDYESPTEGHHQPIPDAIDKTEHHRPIMFGLQVGIPLSKRWSLNTGLNYTYLYSEFDTGYKKLYTHTVQKLHYVGLPLTLNYSLYRNRVVNLYVGMGGRFDLGVSGTSIAHVINNNTKISSSSKRLSDLPFIFSPSVAPGIQFNIVKGLNIYAEPSLQINRMTSKDIQTYYNEHTLMFDIHFGLRWNCSK